MALANHETQFDIGVDAALSETSLHKVPNGSVRFTLPFIRNCFGMHKQNRICAILVIPD